MASRFVIYMPEQPDPKRSCLIRIYWIEFITDQDYPYPPGIRIGCGVTAYSVDEAKILVKTKVFEGLTLPEIKSIIEIEDASQIEQGHVLPNSGNFLNYGVWFPNQSTG